MQKLVIIGLFLGFLCSNLVAHDIHVSVTEITVKNDQSMDISLRIFFDDLLLACGLKPGEPIPDNYSSSDELIEEYVEQHFKLYRGDKRLALQYDESFTDNMAVWIELKAEASEDDLNELTIENTILIKEFDDQLNILNWSREQKTSSTSFTRKKKRTTIQV